VRDGVIKHSEVEYINSIPDTVRFKGNVENNEPSLTTDIEEYNPENINSVYDVDVLKFNIDHRVPTSHARDILDLGEPVYSDSLVRRKEHYNVDTSRRGKLLPYKWQRNTIALRMVFIDPNKIGVNYAKGDTFVPFGTHGTGGLVRVDTVDSSGGITDVSIVEHGQDFDVRDFLRSDHGTALVQNLTLVEETVQSGGSGAVIHIASGEVILISEVFEDKGPIEHAEPTKISMSSNNGKAGKNGRADGRFEVPISINSNDSNKYDVFLHFHNDTSYTLAEDYAFSPASQQFLDLEITPGVV
jgi:hypothetical protein